MAKAGISKYPLGSLVMIKETVDQTKQLHKLRPRWRGPYKILKEFPTNLEVIDWSPDKQVTWQARYKGEGRIPKFERFLVNKEFTKPCQQAAFYYDHNLTRQFFNLFWESVESLNPITEVVPDHVKMHDICGNKYKLDNYPTPGQLGIVPFQTQHCANMEPMIPRQVIQDDIQDDSVSASYSCTGSGQSVLPDPVQEQSQDGPPPSPSPQDELITSRPKTPVVRKGTPTHRPPKERWFLTNSATAVACPGDSNIIVFGTSSMPRENLSIQGPGSSHSQGQNRSEIQTRSSRPRLTGSSNKEKEKSTIPEYKDSEMPLAFENMQRQLKSHFDTLSAVLESDSSSN